MRLLLGLPADSLLPGRTPAKEASGEVPWNTLHSRDFIQQGELCFKRAVVAVAPKILVAIYHMLTHLVRYHDLGDLYLDHLNKRHVTRNLVRRLERLGYTVTLELAAG